MSALAPEVLSKIGYNRKDMLRWCTYNSRNCKDDEFTDIVDPDAGKCFSFNWNARNIAEKSGEKAGQNNSIFDEVL